MAMCSTSKLSVTSYGYVLYSGGSWLLTRLRLSSVGEEISGSRVHRMLLAQPSGRKTAALFHPIIYRKPTYATLCIIGV